MNFILVKNTYMYIFYVLENKKIPIVAAKASGFENVFGPDRAVDGGLGLASCFIAGKQCFVFVPASRQ